jgi:hypothetical protein
MGVVPAFSGDYGTILFTPNFSKYMAMVKWKSVHSRGRRLKYWRQLHDDLTEAFLVINREMYVAGEPENMCLVPTKFIQ